LRGDITLWGDYGSGETRITRTGDRFSGQWLCDVLAVASLPVELELDPPQPEPVADAIAEALGGANAPGADPWWRAGVAENLREE
jgi:hypothetical protein